MPELLLFLLGPMLAALLLQFFLLHRTRSRSSKLRFLRFLVPLNALVPLFLALQVWFDQAGFFWQLAFLFWLAVAAAILLGYALAWGVFVLLRRRERKDQPPS